MTPKALAFSKDLSLPIDAATQTFAFLGRKGSGKTYGAGKLIELLLAAHVQTVILDTVGNWYGLRLAADGKNKGFDIPVIGGLRGDIPLEEGAGALIADTLIDTGRSAIIDVSQFSLAARQRFATAFGERLWTRKKADHHPAPLMLVLEEAQLIVPQNVQSSQARMVGIFEEIVRLGRNYGIGATLISQRPQSVNKEVLTQTECLCVFQVNGSQERDALKKWIVAQGADVDLVKELPSLPIGTAYVWSPQWLGIFKRLEVAPKVTFDSSATPKVGVKRPAARALAPLNLEDLSERMRDVVERQKQEDPKALRARVAELERELERKAFPVPKVTTPKVVKVPVFDAQSRARLDKLITLHSKITIAIGELCIRVDKVAPTRPDGGELERAIRLSTTGSEKRHTPAIERAFINSESGERKILIACAQYGAVDRSQLTVLTGYKRTTRDEYLKRLRAKGFVEALGENRFRASEAGIAELGDDFQRLPTGDALREYWLRRLPRGESEVLKAIASAYPNPQPRDTITDATGYKRTTRDEYVKRLAARKLVVPSRDGIRASGELFG